MIPRLILFPKSLENLHTETEETEDATEASARLRGGGKPQKCEQTVNFGGIWVYYIDFGWDLCYNIRALWQGSPELGFFVAPHEGRIKIIDNKIRRISQR